MLRMSYERETVEQIRSEVDRYDKYQQLDQNPAIGVPSEVTEPRIFLCAEVRRSLTVSAYGNILSEDFGIKDFVTPLLDLLQGKIGSNARFNQVSILDFFLLHMSDLSGENIFFVPSLLSISRDW